MTDAPSITEEQRSELRAAGCTCPHILHGWRPLVGPRCRMCGTVVAWTEKP